MIEKVRCDRSRMNTDIYDIYSGLPRRPLISLDVHY